MSEPFRLTSHGYQELRGSFPSPKAEVEISEDSNSSRLKDILRDMDQLKREIHERMRHMEATNLAKTPNEPPAVSSPFHQESLPDIKHNGSLAILQQPERLNSFSPLIERVEVSREPNLDFDSTIDSPDPASPEVGSGSERDAHLESAHKLMASAAEAWGKAQSSLQEAKIILEQSTLRLNEARAKEEQAASDLRSTQQELTTAYQFAAAAAQMQKDATLHSRKVSMWAVGAIVMAWIAASWFAWISFHARITVFVPIAATAIMLGTGFALERRNNRED